MTILAGLVILVIINIPNPLFFRSLSIHPNSGEKDVSRKREMFVAANFIKASAQVLGMVLNIYMWVIIIRALLSWVNPDPYNPIVQFLYKATEPVLHKVRQWIPMRGMMIDFSPIIVILAIFFLQTFLVESMIRFSMELQ